MWIQTIDDIASTADAGRAALEKVALGMGYLEVGLGLGQIFAPDAVARLTGRPPRSRLTGFRNLAAGIGIVKEVKWRNRRTSVTAVRNRQRSAGRRAGVALAAIAGATVAAVLISKLKSSQAGDRSLRLAARVDVPSDAPPDCPPWKVHVPAY